MGEYKNNMNKVKNRLILLIAIASITLSQGTTKSPEATSKALNAELCMKRFVGVFDKISENGDNNAIDFSYDSFFRILRVLKASIESEVCALGGTYLGDLAVTGSSFDQDCKKRISGIY